MSRSRRTAAFKQSTVKGAILDVDGTLVDSVELHAKAWQAAFARFGHELSFERIRHQIGKGGDQLMPVFLSPAELKRDGKALAQFRDRLFRKHFLASVRPFPGVRSLLRKFRAQGWKIAVASSANQRDLAFLLKRCQITDLLDAVISADDADRSKPHPDIFKAAIAKIGARPENCWAIGDSPYDALAAGRASMPAVGVLCGGFSRASLKRAGAKRIYPDVRALRFAPEFFPASSATVKKVARRPLKT